MYCPKFSIYDIFVQLQQNFKNFKNRYWVELFGILGELVEQPTLNIQLNLCVTQSLASFIIYLFENNFNNIEKNTNSIDSPNPAY